MSASNTVLPVRYAGYIRTSTEEQIGNFSLDAQRRAIEAWVRAYRGVLTTIYSDEAQSAQTMERPAFQTMRREAFYGHFDAIVVHKFDRLSRDRKESLAVKSLLRYEYGVRVYSVNEPSEDSHGEVGMYIEGLMECVAEWYIRNLSDEMAKGKRERSQQGLHNNQAPFGMRKDDQGVLIGDEHELPGLIMAFEA